MSKHQGTLWRVDMKDGLTVKVEGQLHVTPRRTALVWCDCGDGPRHLMFGALARMIESITAIEE